MNNLDIAENIKAELKVLIRRGNTELTPLQIGIQHFIDRIQRLNKQVEELGKELEELEKGLKETDE